MINHPDDECPICHGKATPLDAVINSRGFECQSGHGRFRVSLTAFALPHLMDAGTDQWELALKKAKARQPDAWAPTIEHTDF